MDKFTLIIILSLIIAAPAGHYANGMLLVNGGSGAGGGAASQTATYVVVTDGTTVSVINGTTGIVAYSGTDADVAIQSALDYLYARELGGNFYIKNGHYIIEHRGGFPIVINGNDISFECESLDTRLELRGHGYIFRFRNATNIGAYGGDNGDPRDKPHHGSVTGCTMLGDPTNNEAQYINFFHYDFGSVINNNMGTVGDECVEWTNGDYGIMKGNYLEDCVAASPFGGAISIQSGSDNILIDGNFVNGTGAIGTGGWGVNVNPVNFRHAQNVTIINNFIQDTAKDCIFVQMLAAAGNTDNQTGVVIKNNHLSNCQVDAIQLNGVPLRTMSGIIIDGNVITGGGNDVGSSGIRCSQLKSQSSITISNNHISNFGADNTGSGTEGILCNGEIIGNTVINAGGRGIVCGDLGGSLRRCAVIGNTVIGSGVHESGAAGIFVSPNVINADIIGNSLIDRKGTPTQNGIEVNGRDVTFSRTITFNYFKNNVEDIDDNTTNTVVRAKFNIGKLFLLR